MKVAARIRQRDVVHAVVDLAAIAVVLRLHAGRVRSALGRARFVDHADRPRVRMLARHQLLATIAEQPFIPLEVREEPLQRPRRLPLIESHRFDIFALHVAQQSVNINP